LSVLLGKYMVSVGVGVGSSSLLLQLKNGSNTKRGRNFKIFISWF
jgi:hypothetical protein